MFNIFMSLLTYIGDYGSSSEDSDNCLEDPPKIKKIKLPTPDLRKVAVVALNDHEDNPILHNGRIRSFPHVRGNWASYVYIKYPEDENVLKLINKLAVFQSEFHICQDLHISLSKTQKLKYHLITPFTSSLQTSLEGTGSFNLGFESVKVYCNEENNRTFISLKVDQIGNKYLLNIAKKVDVILEDFNLPTFYDDPSFHMSVLWTNGNKKTEISENIESLNNIFLSEIEKSSTNIFVSKVNCKIGNKYFQYSLL